MSVSTKSTNVAAPVIGIDVAKDTLAIAVLDPAALVPGQRPTARVSWSCATAVSDLVTLLHQMTDLLPSLVVLEATGGYERGVLDACWAAGLPVAVVNPRRVRHFARAAGYAAKTDRLDAVVLAHFGLVTRPAPQAAPPASLVRVRALVRRREQLVAVLATERQRAGQWARTDPMIHADCQTLIATLVAAVATVEEQLRGLLAAEADLGGLVARLQTVPGVGLIVAVTVLALLPELGTATDKELAALAGLAPYSRESGSWRGERHIAGGRASVRRVLYLAAVSARRCNPTIRETYERLTAKHKASKVALVACARKLLTVLNALMRTGSDWVDRAATT